MWLNFTDTVIFKIFRYPISTNIRMYILVKNRPDSRRFFFVNLKFSIYKLITIWCKTAVLFSLTNFLNTTFQYLDTDISRSISATADKTEIISFPALHSKFSICATVVALFLNSILPTLFLFLQ